MAKGKRRRTTLFPEEKWVKRIPFFVMAYTLAMLLLGIAVSGSSTLFQHLYIYSFGIGLIFLIFLFLILWRKSQVRVFRTDIKDDKTKR